MARPRRGWPGRSKGKESNVKIAVAGTGYVGLSLAVLLAQHNQVTAVDVVAEKVACINAGRSPIADRELEEYLAHKPLRLTATTDGDAAYRDAQGRYWFHGRFDDIIKTGGYRVGPYEVENVLMEHPAVVECSVIGVPDPLRGQAIKAFIVLGNREPTAELEKEIKDFCNARLAEYKWVRLIEFVKEMPKTISGKIRKTELRATT